MADKNYDLLKADPFHPSLHVGDHYRALGIDKPEGVVWFFIGTHAEYDALLV